MSIETTIQQHIDAHPILLFMKGTRDFPQCGFSATVVQILEQFEVDFFCIDVLDDPEIRQGIKLFSNWPTIPQLYVKGQFVGGCDIVKNLYEQDELEAMLKSAASA